MEIFKQNKQRLSLTLQPLQDCNAYLCQIATVWNYRNATALCQNATDLCENDDPSYSLEGLNKRVSNGTSAPPLFDRSTSYVLCPL